MYITLRINSHLTVKKEQKSEVPEPTHTHIHRFIRRTPQYIQLIRNPYFVYKRGSWLVELIPLARAYLDC